VGKESEVPDYARIPEAEHAEENGERIPRRAARADTKKLLDGRALRNAAS
jgi:hypothetical protein